MKFNTSYNIRDLVYLATDPEQHPRIVTGIMISPGGISYELSFGDCSSHHYDFEFTYERDFVKMTSQ